MTPTRTVAVIGGGIGGLAVAAALHARGVEARVYEQASALTEVGAGISLWPNATRVLAQLGALEALVPSAGPIRALDVRAASGQRLLRAQVRAYAFPALCVYRPELVEALAARLPPGALQTGRKLVTVAAEGDQAELAFADGTTVAADVVVGADGLRSRVRAYVIGDAAGPVYRGYTIWRGLAPLPEAFVPGEAVETWGKGQRFGLLDTGRGRAYWYATANSSEGAFASSADDRKAEVLARFSAWHRPIPDVIRSTPATALIQGDVYDRPPQRGWSRGRAVLLGDAAHSTTPNLGQGGCLALEDASVLAQALTTTASAPEAFRAYEQARYSRTARVVRESLWTGRLGQAEAWRADLRDAAAHLTPGALYARRLGWLFAYDATAALHG